MIVVEKGQLRFLIAGRAVEVGVKRHYRKGRVYPVGWDRDHATWRAKVVECVGGPDGPRATLELVTEEAEVFIAASWPDYTTNPMRAMNGEPPPMPETLEERKERAQWLTLGGADTLKRKTRKVKSTPTRRERVVHSAGSPEALRVVRSYLSRNATSSERR